MKIVDRETFRSLPVGTVYAKYAPCYFEDMGIKDENFGSFSDFWSVDLTTPSFVGAAGTEAWTETLDSIQAGQPSPPLDFETVARHGAFDDGQLFAVYEEADVLALIARLQRALVDQKANP